MKSATLLLLLCATATAQDAPKKAYWSAVAVASSTTAADAYTTINPRFHGPGCAFEVGSAWLYGRTPQTAPGRTAALMAGEVAISSAASWALRKHKRFWFLPLAYTATIHGQSAARNFYNCR